MPDRDTTNVWLTPPEVHAAVGGWESFDLDPASPANRPWPTARAHYTKADDGLAQLWFGRVWLNPPYGRELIRWLEKLGDHDRGIALIFARTDTEAFFRHVWGRAAGLLFLRGRLTFYDEQGQPARNLKTGKETNSGAPSVLCAYGMADLDVLAGCGLDGQLVPLRLPRAVFVAGLSSTWRELLVDRLSRRGPVTLDEVYRAIASHPKASGNPHWRDKVRQVLQRGPFRRVARGTYEAVEECAA
jgi:hypothetical protein